MQRLLITSDFHTDINGVRPPQIGAVPALADADILVVAGDVGQLNALTQTLPKLCDLFPSVIYVAGNHDYYDSSFDTTNAVLAELDAKISNLYWLNNSTATINGRRFVGTTLWFPRTHQVLAQGHGFTDFRWISDMWVRFGSENEKAQKFLHQTVRSEDVVVTHHAPSPMSIAQEYKRSLSNCFFYTDMRHLIASAQPHLWVHGHMHDPSDYRHGKTRVLANPYGYESRGETRTFNPNLTVEI